MDTINQIVRDAVFWYAGGERICKSKRSCMN
jgi:hypothetical protein